MILQRPFKGRVFPLLILGVSLLISPIISIAQVLNLPLNRDYQSYMVGRTADSTFNFHPALQPYLASNLKEHNNSISKLDISTNKKWMDVLLNQDTFNTTPDRFDIAFNPILNTVMGMSTDESGSTPYEMGVGIGMAGYYDQKVALEINYQYNQFQFQEYARQYSLQRTVIPGYGMASDDSTTFSNHFFTGYVSYSPATYINFQVGRGKHFIGNGYRSLILSDNSDAYWYGKIDLNIWKFRYQVLYSQYKGSRWTDMDDYTDKYSTSNFLSMNFGRHLNVGLFQSVIWQATDSSLNRGFDVNYLNPFIFTRPVEYSVGSPDNVLLGMDISYLLFKKLRLYSQVIIDEFLLNEIKSNSGWWANKYGFQLGFKVHDLGIQGLTLLTEYNYVRPFTYSHSNEIQNYGHEGQPLAHPLEANFDEMIGRVTYVKKRWLGTVHVAVAAHGIDYANTNLGGSIYKSNVTRTQEYGNQTGQGNLVKQGYMQAKVGYLINPGWKLMAEAGFTYRSWWSETPYSGHNSMIHFGIKTALYNQYLDF